LPGSVRRGCETKRVSGYVGRDVIPSESKTLERTEAQEGIGPGAVNHQARGTDPLLVQGPEGGQVVWAVFRDETGGDAAALIWLSFR
jgi:hypothetical protein